MHASFELASKWARNFPYSEEMDNLPSPTAARPPAIVVGDRSPTAGDGAGRFHFHNKKGQRTLPGFRRALAPIRSSDLN